MPDLGELRVKDEHLARVLAGEEFLVEDGGMGTLLQARNLIAPGELPDLLNLTCPDEITALHRAYVQAGAELATTNTFGANALKFAAARTRAAQGDATAEGVARQLAAAEAFAGDVPSAAGDSLVAAVYAAAAENARAAGARYVAGDIGPLGELLEPIGSLSFERAYEVFAEQACAADAAGCDLIVIETIADLREAKAAVLAARDNTDLPVFVTMTFDEGGRTLMGTTPAIAAATLSALGASAVGMNCSVGPAQMAAWVEEMARFSRCPVLVKPNAGLPRLVDGETVFDVGPGEFADAMESVVAAGASIVGGCCGTTPDHIAALRDRLLGDEAAADRRPAARSCEDAFVVTSAQEMVVLSPGSRDIAVVGERINPTGKRRLAEALRTGDFDYVVGEAAAQTQAGADILDVNAGLPDIDEAATLRDAVEHIQAAVTTPLQIDTSEPEAIEMAARAYAGKPLINSVNGKQSSLDAVLPVVKRCGCAVVGLTLDESGIPPTAAGRLRIAERIVAEAERRGIPRCDVVIDCLVMAAATNQAEIAEVLRAVFLVKERLGVRTLLGVSNVSFGMPRRGLVNTTFLAAALGAGLDLPILNPNAERYRDVVASFRVLNAQDEGARDFIADYAETQDPYNAAAVQPAEGAGRPAPASEPDARPMPGNPSAGEAFDAVLAGRAAPVVSAVETLLGDHDPLAIVNELLVPALDVVGMRYDRGEIFLPQLMASAEAAKAGFALVRERVLRDREASGDGAASEAILSPDAPDRTIILATVEGDIHDIGKNITKMLLENYGFPVIDLGLDVPPSRVVETARARGVRMVGLSALMTTTVKAMERTIRLLRSELPEVAVMVGGAVLTPGYAASMGADFYAKDAAESARIATRYFAELEALRGRYRVN